MLDFSFKGSSLHVNMNSVQAESVQLSGAKDSDLMGTLVMTGVGLLTQRLYTCKMTTDMMLAAAAGLAFIGGEITAYMGLKDAMKDIQQQIDRDKVGNLTQTQIDTFKRLKESYQKALKAANTKKSLQNMAAMAFAAAAVSAYMQYSAETTALSTCNTALSAASSACTSAFAASCAGAGATCYYPFQTGAANAAATVAPVSNQAIMALTPEQSNAKMMQDKATDATISASLSTMSSQCPAATPAMAACKAIATLNLTTKGYCPAPLVVDNSTISKNLYANNYTPIIQSKQKIDFFKNLFMSEARAELFSPMGIASSAAISYVLATSKTLGMQIDMFMFSPMNRAIAWGVLGGLTYGAMSATDKQIKTIEDNIKKIDDILNSMNALANGVQTANVNPNTATSASLTTQNPTITSTTVANESVNLGTSLPCMTGGDPKKCPSFSTQLNAQPTVIGMPDFVQQQISNIATVTDGLNGQSTISSSTMNGVNNLAGQSNAIRAELAKQQKLAQAKLKASGSNIDLAKESAKLDASLKDTLKKELDKRKTTAGDMLANFGANKFGMGGSSAAVATDAGKGKTGSKKGSSLAIPTVAIPAAVIPSMKDNTALKTDQANEKKAPEVANVKTASIDEYELENDITKDKETSIFELISNRYKTSGYPRLFKKLKE